MDLDSHDHLVYLKVTLQDRTCVGNLRHLLQIAELPSLRDLRIHVLPFPKGLHLLFS
jgi:hypothetical protein